MTEEEKEEYEELKSLLYTGQISQYGKRKLIEIIEKQDTEINKLNRVIDRMAEVIEECRQNDCIETTDDLDMSEIAGVEKIKEYFMKEDK